MAEQQLEELRWLGLDWDGPPVFQSHAPLTMKTPLRRLQTMSTSAFVPARRSPPPALLMATNVRAIRALRLT